MKRFAILFSIAVLIFGAAVLMARYPMVRAHIGGHETYCIGNLREIDDAKQVWAQENPNLTNHTLLWSDVQPYLGRGTQGTLPVCPQGGTYTLGKIGELTKCSYPGHSLE